MGIVGSFMESRVAQALGERDVLVWYDPARAWVPCVESWLRRCSQGDSSAVQATLGGKPARIVVSDGSHYAILQACEPLVSGSELPRLLVYVPGEAYLEMLSPLRELECLGGEKEPYQRDLIQVTRQALQSAGIAESKIDDLLDREGLDFAYLDSISVGDGGASPLAPVFGSSRELDVIPSFLVEPERRAEAAAKGLLREVARLASQGLGLRLSDGVDAEAMARELARALLVAELRSDLDGPEPVAISQIAAPTSADQIERVRAVCRKLRREHPEAYEGLADAVEKELRLAQAGIDPETLGRIDTFRFEAQCLLEACDRRLAAGQADRALAIVEGREGSFWSSVSRYPTRHAAWEAAGELARLALAVGEVAKSLERPPPSARGWVDTYTALEGWHRVDQRFREARYRVTRLEDRGELEKGADRVFGRYDAVLERMATGFVSALQAEGWQLEGVLRQEEVYDRHVARSPEAVAYVLADAMRFEMGAELARLLGAVGATGVRVEPALAVAPTITDLGMAALMPGAERSFSMAASPKGVTGSIGGKALLGSAARMEHAKGRVPGLMEMTLDRLVQELSPKRCEEELKGAKVVVIRSQEIDGAGENLAAGIAQKVMGTILEELRSGVQRLADAGIRRFVIVADHGHLFGERRGEDMRIDPPEGGKTVDLHRRCWVGKGGSTPSACVRLSAGDLGYEGTNLDLVVPKGTGIFRAAGGGLAFHHGGLSLQELIVPVLTFELERKKAAKKRVPSELLALEGVDKQITNRIFSLRLKPVQLDLLEPLKLRVIAQSTADKSTAAQAAWASEGWDPEGRVITLVSGEPVEVRLLLDDDAVEELRILVIEATTSRVLKDTEPIPVKVLT